MAATTLSDLVSLRGQGAIVTGAGRGIGAGIAARLAEGGAGVLIVDRNPADAEATVGRIREAGGRAEAFVGDVSDIRQANAAVDAAVRAFGRLDILVNNAGVFPTSTVMNLSEEVWDRTCDLNLKALVFWSQAAAQQMIKAGRGGRIINITSVNATLPHLNLPHYAATKGGVSAATRAFAQELGQHGIRVNSVAPGGVDTPGGREAATAMLGGAPLPEGPIGSRSVLGRSADPDDIGRAVYFLACGLSDYITGSNVPVDGGYLLL